MKINHQLLVLLFLLSSSFLSHAQEDTLVFAKDRVITSLFGSITNQEVRITSGSTANTTGYTLGTKSGLFIENNLALGINFSISKSEYKDININIESEDLLFGLWSRYYFAQNGNAALYAELTPFYTGINRENQIIDNTGNVTTNEEVSGNGFGVAPGIGFTYIINRNVGFGMTLAYSMAKLNVDKSDLILNTVVPDSYNVSQLQLSFNFQVYLDQFFF